MYWLLTLYIDAPSKKADTLCPKWRRGRVYPDVEECLFWPGAGIRPSKMEDNLDDISKHNSLYKMSARE